MTDDILTTTVVEAVLCSADAEEALLGSAIVDQTIFDEFEIEPNDFHIIRLRTLWGVLQKMNKSKVNIDYITILDELERQGILKTVGGDAYIAKLINCAGMRFMAGDYISIIKRFSKRREIMQVANELAKIAYGDAEEMQAAVSAQALKLVSGMTPRTATRHINAPLGEVVAEIEKRALNPTDVWGIQTGFLDLDAYLGGLQKGEMLYLAGEPGVGKTKLAIQIAVNAALPKYGGNKVAIYSLEMKDTAVSRRIVSGIGKVSTRSMLSGKMTDDDWNGLWSGISQANDMQLYINDQSDLTTHELKADIIRLKANEGIDLVVVDYLILMGGYDKLEEDERSQKISRELKGIAKDENVALIAVNSVTKEGMDTNFIAKKNLRGSGQLIHDADLVAFLVKDEKQNYLAKSQLMQAVKLIFAKVREVEMGGKTIDLLADPHYPIFHTPTTTHLELG